jgi:hypothetical protein
MEGIPSSATRDQGVGYLRSIDSTLGFAGNAVEVEVQPPVSMVIVETASSKKAMIRTLRSQAT